MIKYFYLINIRLIYKNNLQEEMDKKEIIMIVDKDKVTS